MVVLHSNAVYGTLVVNSDFGPPPTTDRDRCDYTIRRKADGDILVTRRA